MLHFLAKASVLLKDSPAFAYERRDHCFAWLQDERKTQALVQAQLRTDWSALLEGLARRSNPLHENFFAGSKEVTGSSYGRNTEKN